MYLNSLSPCTVSEIRFNSVRENVKVTVSTLEGMRQYLPQIQLLIFKFPCHCDRKFDQVYGHRQESVIMRSLKDFI